MDFGIMAKNIVDILAKYWKVFLLEGVTNTLFLSFIAVLFGTIIGALFALGKMAPVKPLQWIITAVVEVTRGTPMLLQLYLFVFLLPSLIPSLNNINNANYICVAVALVLNSAAYTSEIIRSGIEAVDKGQTEASRSLGLSKTTTMISIVLPQAIKNILPALGNEFITVVKETSLASTFFIGDLMTSYLKVKGINYLTMECLIITGAIYFILNFILSKILVTVERRMKARA